MAENKKAQTNGTKLVPGKGRMPYPAYRGSEPYIFVSYSHRDSALVFMEIERLNKLGYHVWYDEGISPGNEWTQEIAQALEHCSMFVVFFTPNSAESDNVQNEIDFCLNEKKPCLGVYLKQTNLQGRTKLRFGMKQAILKYNMTEEEYVFKLVGALEQLGMKVADKVDVSSTINKTSAQENKLMKNKKIMIAALSVGGVIILCVSLALSGVFSGSKNNSTGDASKTTDSGNTTADSGGADGDSSDTDKVTLDENNDSKYADEYLYSYNYDKTGVSLDKYFGTGHKKVEIPAVVDGLPVVSINEKCFEDNKEIESLVLPETLQVIHYRAFYGCENLKSMNIPASLTKILGWAFAHTGFVNVSFPETFMVLDYGMFYGCSSLETVTLSSAIDYLDENTFRGCDNLKKVVIPCATVDIDIKAFEAESGVVLVGVKGSYTEKYAKAMGLTFQEY